MKKGLIIVVAMMLSVASYSQTVTGSANGAIIDCSGMLAAAYTETPKARTTDGDDRTLGTNSAANLGSAVSNAQVYKKFEVYKTDNAEGTGWLHDLNLCANTTTDGGGWRLPTQRELMLIMVLKTDLEAVAGFDGFRNQFFYYRSATESNNYNAWLVTSGGDTVGYNEKTFWPVGVRCVRDITP